MILIKVFCFLVLIKLSSSELRYEKIINMKYEILLLQIKSSSSSNNVLYIFLKYIFF